MCNRQQTAGKTGAEAMRDAESKLPTGSQFGSNGRFPRRCNGFFQTSGTPSRLIALS